MSKEIKQDPEESTQPTNQAENVTRVSELDDAELDEINGGQGHTISRLTKIIQAKNDMQKGIIQNFRV